MKENLLNNNSHPSPVITSVNFVVAKPNVLLGNDHDYAPSFYSFYYENDDSFRVFNLAGDNFRENIYDFNDPKLNNLFICSDNRRVSKLFNDISIISNTNDKYKGWKLKKKNNLMHLQSHISDGAINPIKIHLNNEQLNEFDYIYIGLEININENDISNLNFINFIEVKYLEKDKTLKNISYSITDIINAYNTEYDTPVQYSKFYIEIIFSNNSFIFYINNNLVSDLYIDIVNYYFYYRDITIGLDSVNIDISYTNIYSKLILKGSYNNEWRGRLGPITLESLPINYVTSYTSKVKQIYKNESEHDIISCLSNFYSNNRLPTQGIALLGNDQNLIINFNTHKFFESYENDSYEDWFVIQISYNLSFNYKLNNSNDVNIKSEFIAYQDDDFIDKRENGYNILSDNRSNTTYYSDPILIFNRDNGEPVHYLENGLDINFKTYSDYHYSPIIEFEKGIILRHVTLTSVIDNHSDGWYQDFLTDENLNFVHFFNIEMASNFIYDENSNDSFLKDKQKELFKNIRHLFLYRDENNIEHCLFNDVPNIKINKNVTNFGYRNTIKQIGTKPIFVFDFNQMKNTGIYSFGFRIYQPDGIYNPIKIIINGLNIETLSFNELINDEDIDLYVVMVFDHILAKIEITISNHDVTYNKKIMVGNISNIDKIEINSNDYFINDIYIDHRSNKSLNYYHSLDNINVIDSELNNKYSNYLSDVNIKHGKSSVLDYNVYEALITNLYDNVNMQSLENDFGVMLNSDINNQTFFYKRFNLEKVAYYSKAICHQIDIVSRNINESNIDGYKMTIKYKDYINLSNKEEVVEIRGCSRNYKGFENIYSRIFAGNYIEVNSNIYN